MDYAFSDDAIKRIRDADEYKYTTDGTRSFRAVIAIERKSRSTKLIRRTVSFLNLGANTPRIYYAKVKALKIFEFDSLTYWIVRVQQSYSAVFCR